MPLAIAYEKYEYMTKRQIFNALLNAEKKYEKMKSDLENQKNLVSFLKAKSKKKINEISYTPNDETIKAIQECEQDGNSKSYNSYDDFLKELKSEI